MIQFIAKKDRPPTIPRKVKIGPHIVRVQLVDPKVLDPESENIFGDWNYTKLRIRIDKTACPAMQYSSFVHELVEALNSLYELRLSHNRRTTLETALQDIEPL